MNVALHGMEQAAGVRYLSTDENVRNPKVRAGAVDRVSRRGALAVYVPPADGVVSL